MILSGTRASLNHPLMSGPGTRWGYGPSIDWLGLREEIFEPLGMRDTFFEGSEDKQGRLAAVRICGADGTLGPIEVSPPAKPDPYPNMRSRGCFRTRCAASLSGR